MTIDDPLFDPELEPDDELAAISEALAEHRYRPREYSYHEAPRRGRRWPLLVGPVAAAALLWLAASLGLFEDAPALSPSYRLETLAGTPLVGGAVVVEGGVLRAGQLLDCDDASRVRLTVGTVGSVELGPGSRVRAERLAAGGDEAAWRLSLERGELSASIFAAPRLFQVGTPAGLAVDMGCIYRAVVDGDGVTELTVRGGLVSFEGAGHRVWVPEGAVLRAEPGRRLGTPVWLDLPEALRDGITLLDSWAWAGQAAAPSTLDDEQAGQLAVLQQLSEPRHGLMLWHLLQHPWQIVRAAAYDQLAALIPPQDLVTREGVLGGDERMLREWRQRVAYEW